MREIKREESEGLKRLEKKRVNRSLKEREVSEGVNGIEKRVSE